MSLLIVVLASEEAGELTLDEWDALTARRTVLFETPGHPLEGRLAKYGIATGLLDRELDPADDGSALVAEPDSPVVVDLARSGASVSVGAARPPDDLTAGHGARIGRRASRSLGELALVMARLRGPDGCPWDHEQTHESLQVHLLEEAHEVLEAIDRGELGPELEEELGDLLLQVVFHAQMAADDGRFDIDGVARRLVAKLVHRHPHVFGDRDVADAAEVVTNWETIKAGEKRGRKRSGPFDDIPAGLPALLAAHKTQKRAAGMAPQVPVAEARTRVETALAAGDVGEALFWLVAVARGAGVDAEGALRRATERFRDSF